MKQTYPDLLLIGEIQLGALLLRAPARFLVERLLVGPFDYRLACV